MDLGEPIKTKFNKAFYAYKDSAVVADKAYNTWITYTYYNPIPDVSGSVFEDLFKLDYPH